MLIDPIKLSQDLIKLPSITPDKGDTLDLLQKTLESLGFHVERITFSEPGTASVPNLYARLGKTGPNICFAGHTDVVPVGAVDKWKSDPFAAEIIDGNLYGRGAADMKSAIAAFIAAVSRYLENDDPETGSISLLITGDEEGPAINGTKKVLDWLQERDETLDYCIVGEPTNPSALGQMVKIGRRGSLHGTIKVEGVQGHVAYPHHAHNPIPDMVKLLATLEEPLDFGNDNFQPSNLEIVDIHVGNDSHNVIPAEARAHINIRFNTSWTPESLQQEITSRLDKTGVDYDIQWVLSGNAFLTPKCSLSDAVSKAIEKRLGVLPELSTTGGTSDARFIKDMCPVVEFGLVGQTMHKIDEHVAIDDIETLTQIYKDVLASLLNR